MTQSFKGEQTRETREVEGGMGGVGRRGGRGEGRRTTRYIGSEDKGEEGGRTTDFYYLFQ
jgi:hypothetical protein